MLAVKMPRTRKNSLQFFFEDRTLTIFRRGKAVRHITAWPEPHAQELDRIGNWQRFRPEFRIINYPLKPRKSRQKIKPQLELGLEIDSIPAKPGLCSKKAAYDLLRKSIPAPYSAKLAPFYSHQWNPLVFLSINEQFLDLLESSPTLAFFLANTDAISERVLYNALQIKDLVRMPQARLMGMLRLPETKSAIKMMRKLAPESASPDNFPLLKKVLLSKELRQKAAHLETINTGILQLLCRDPRLHPHLTPRLLLDVSKDRKSRFSQSVYWMLRETVRGYLDIHDEQPGLPAIRSLDHLQTLHTEVLTAYAQRASEQKRASVSRPFHAPPIKGTSTIIPLRTEQELREEGVDQHNCVGGYGPSVRSRRKYIYAVTEPERATLAIEQGAGGTWIISELFATCNQPVEQDTLDAVEEWLQENQEGI